MKSGDLPHFKRLHDESQVYISDAECEGEELNPWVQWVTVHTGLSAAEHGIRQLSEGHTLPTKAIWDLISDAGQRVWICGSMNSRYDKPLNGYLLPDPWSTGLSPYPEGEFEPYYNFVRFMVQEHTNKEAGLSKSAILGFVKYMATHGLSAATVTSIVKQLLTERRTNKGRWKRAALMDRLQWDLFKRYYRKYAPSFSTFFLNSTAHFQHAYWRNMEPEEFAVKPSQAEQEDHEDAILYGYQNMDDLLGRFMHLAGNNATLIFSTGLSQQPYLKYEETGGRHYYRIKSPQLLGEKLKVKGKYSYHPVMAEQFVLRFEDQHEAEAALQLLDGYRLPERQAFNSYLRGSDLIVQCNEIGAVKEGTTITSAKAGQTIPFYDIFYLMDDLKSAYHHPDGMLWVRTPDRKHAVHEEKVSLRSIAPAVLEMFDVPIPSFMTCPPFTKTAREQAVPV
jgi:hypothetical protein